MIEPKEIQIKTQAGVEKTYVLSKFPSIAGREIISKYPVTNAPKLGDYLQSEEVMMKLLSFVAVVTSEGKPLALTTRALVDNHVPDWETLMRLEWAQLEYNCSFFKAGLISSFSESFSPKVAKWISKTLIPLLAQSLQADAPTSTSSKPPTA
jgi:hypothetical protein